MQNIISWGFISCYIFMATNFYFADDTIVEYKFKIEEKDQCLVRKDIEMKESLWS